MLPLSKMASHKDNSVMSCQLGGQEYNFYLIWLGTPMALPIAPVLSFKLLQVAHCFKPGPTYRCLAVPLLWHDRLHKY